MTHPMTQAIAEVKRALTPKNAALVAARTQVFVPPISWVELYDRKHVDSILYRRVKAELLERIPALPGDVILPMKKICSPEFWASLDDADKRLAGRCLMHFVVKKEIDLLLVSRSGVSPQLYCKKP